jgi:anhydro-N-acetylmuramic acid kinase
MTQLFIGLMSGTSLDGVDGVVVALEADRLNVLAHASAALPSTLAIELLALNLSGSDELHRSALASNALMHVYAQVVELLLASSQLQRQQIVAIGAHGQTVRHQPQMHAGTGYTLQLANPALLAELTGIDVVADFRSRDVAAGGQGAPLVPVFHQSVFGKTGQTTAVINIGGMANLTVIGSANELMGFDCGPGNVLMDTWCQQNLGQPFDANGAWAASGQVHAELLSTLLADPFLR